MRHPDEQHTHGITTAIRSSSIRRPNRRPDLDFVALARGMGVPGQRVEDARALYDAIRAAVAEPGPYLIEALL